MSTLVLHKGARKVSLDELASVPCPHSTPTWFPIPHLAVLETVAKMLEGTAFGIANQHLALSSNNNQFFATLDLIAPLSDGVAMAVGLRNSIDKTLPQSFLGGSRVFICDNLAMSAELMVNRKHTVNGSARFAEACALAIGKLNAFQLAEGGRIDRLRQLEVSNQEAESLVLRAWEQKVINHIQLPAVLREWRTPQHADFEPRTRWSLFNAFTEVLKSMATSSPQSFAGRTFNLNRLLVPPGEGPGDLQALFAETQTELQVLDIEARAEEAVS